MGGTPKSSLPRWDFPMGYYHDYGPPIGHWHLLKKSVAGGTTDMRTNKNPDLSWQVTFHYSWCCNLRSLVTIIIVIIIIIIITF